MTDRTTNRRFSIIICTIVFSATCVVGAVGPALNGAAPAAADAGTPASRLLA